MPQHRPGAEKAPEQAAPTVYYDGACPICVREIGFYRRQAGADLICWTDVGHDGAADIAPDLSRCEALARFTVRGVDGKLVSGGRAFVVIWQSLPRFRWLASVFRPKPCAWLLEQAYRVFLLLRPSLQAAVATASSRGSQR